MYYGGVHYRGACKAGQRQTGEILMKNWFVQGADKNRSENHSHCATAGALLLFFLLLPFIITCITERSLVSRGSHLS